MNLNNLHGTGLVASATMPLSPARRTRQEGDASGTPFPVARP